MNILIFTHASPQFLPPVIVDVNETVCGPHYNNLWIERRYKYINTPAGLFDCNEVLTRLGNQQPDLILVHADATLGCLPQNFPPSIPKVLLIGDTHHLQNPIQNFLSYASNVDFDAIILWNRQHAHFFTEFGFKNVFWMPGLTFAIPEISTSSDRINQLCFFGQIGIYHPRRSRIIQELQREKIPIIGGKLTRRDSLELAARSALSLNITLNGEFNLRVFESTRYGSLLITDKLAEQTGLEIFYKNGEALVTYDNIKDLCQKLSDYSQNPEKARTIAQKGQSITQAYFCFEARRKALFALLNNDVTLEVYRLAGEPRCFLPVCPPENRDDLIIRVQLYERLQELHRIKEHLKIVLSEGVNPLIIADLADLVRLQQYLVIETEDYNADWKPAFDELLVGNLDTIQPQKLATVDSDLLITTLADLDKAFIQEKKHAQVFVSDLFANRDKRLDRAMIESGYKSQHSTLYGLFAV
jgi:hypothetical protein